MSLISALLFGLAVLTTAARAQDLAPPKESLVSTQTVSEDSLRPEELRRPLILFLNTELRYLSTDVVQRRGQEGGELYELSLRLRYQPEDRIALVLDAGVEHFDDDSGFLFRKAELEYKPWRYVEVRAGQTFIPLGFFTENDRWMAELPHYYSTLLPWEKGIDLGARAMVRPFGNDALILDASTFSGRTVRPGDERPGPAETRPTLLQARSQGEDFNLFASLWSHDLAYRDRVEAKGFGFSAKHKFQQIDLEPMLLGEYFRIEEKQKVGPMEQTLAGTALAQLRYRWLTIGGMYAHSRRQILVNAETFVLEPVNEKNVFAEVSLHKTFRLRAEKRQTEENQKTVDDVVWRALFDVQAL